jgi:hypothetical protein
MGLPDETMTHEKNNKSKIVVADQTVTLNQLESHLWESDNILCGWFCFISPRNRQSVTT